MLIQNAIGLKRPIKRPFMKDFLIVGELDHSLVMNAKANREYSCLIFQKCQTPAVLTIEDLLADDWEADIDYLKAVEIFSSYEKGTISFKEALKLLQVIKE